MSDQNRNGTGPDAPRDSGETAPRDSNQTAAFKSARLPALAAAPGKKRKGGAKNRARPAVKVEVRPIATSATMRKRHWGLAASFAACVLLPVLVTMFYLWVIADDQYSSHTGFTVRSEEGSGATDLLGGLASFAKVSTQTDADILYEYIQSQDIVQRIDDKLDLRNMYSAHWASDPIFALKPDATIEDLHAYWERVVRISYNGATGLINLEVLGFAPEATQRVAQEIVKESQAMINTLNETAREDAMRYAEADLQQAVQRIKDARETLTRYRTRTQIVDPQTDIETRLGVLQNLQQQLAGALVEADILEQTTTPNDPRLVQTRQKIDVIRSRIAHERKTFATAENEIGSLGEDYPTLIAEYESLTVDLEFAEQAYRAALTAFDVAKSNALRQSRYLATYVTPTRSQSSEYPRRFVISGLAAVLLVMLWGMGALVFYSLRDRR